MPVQPPEPQVNGTHTFPRKAHEIYTKTGVKARNKNRFLPQNGEIENILSVSSTFPGTKIDPTSSCFQKHDTVESEQRFIATVERPQSRGKSKTTLSSAPVSTMSERWSFPTG
jgi:hypothetical protein